MPSRRSVLAFLGPAPIAAPAAIAAATTPESVIVGVDVTEAGLTVGRVVTPAIIRAELIAQYALIPDPADMVQLTDAIKRASAGTPRASRTPAPGGRFLPSLAGACGSRSSLGDDDRDTRAGAARAARGDQGDGGATATAVPSQSVEKVVPGATGDGDGLTSASGPGIRPGSNSPDWASEMVGGFPVPATPLSRGGTGSERRDCPGVVARRDGTPSLSAWARAGLQNQAPGVRLLPAVPLVGGT